MNKICCHRIIKIIIKHKKDQILIPRFILLMKQEIQVQWQVALLIL